MKILAIGAHPDDIEFGCGGILYKLFKEKHKINLLVMTEGNVGGDSDKRWAEQKKSAAILKAPLFCGGFKDTEISSFFIARYEGEIIGGALVLLGKNYGMWNLSDYDPEYKKYKPNYVLQWNIIKYLKEVNFDYYDMGGIKDLKNSFHGPTLFKKGFGGHISPFYVYRIEFDPILSKVPELTVILKRKLFGGW